MAIGASVYAEDPDQRGVPRSVADNVGQRLARHIAEIHNAHLENPPKSETQLQDL